MPACWVHRRKPSASMYHYSHVRSEQCIGDRIHLQMAVEMDDANWTVLPVDAAQEWEGNCMISTKRDHAWKCPAFLRGAWLFRIGGWRAGENDVMAFLNLLYGECIVV